MAKNKTTYTGKNVIEFINEFVDNDQKKDDSLQLIDYMEKWTGCEAKMWGPSIIGFANYHYKYASGHEGDAPIIAFSPRKVAISLYVYSPTEQSEFLLANLGKFKMTKGCIYIKKLSDIEIETLEQICIESIKYINDKYECGCREK